MLEDLFDRRDGVEWWSDLVNLNLSFLPCISVRNDPPFPGKDSCLKESHLTGYGTYSQGYDFTSLSALSITLPLRSNHIGKRQLSCIRNTKIKTTTKSEQTSKTVTQKTLLYILFRIEQKTLEYCQVLLVSVWQISTWHNNFLSPYFSSCYFIVCHGNRKHLNKPTGNGNQIFTWEDVAWPFSCSLIILSEGFWIQGWQQGGECFLLRD